MDLLRAHFELDALFHIPPAWLSTRPKRDVRLGDILPPELFPRILYYVDKNDTTEEVYKRYGSKSFPEDPDKRLNFALELEQARPFQALKDCSLVCRYWANQCRRYLFYDATLQIDSLESATLFRQYAAQGSPHLLRLCDMIKSIQVTQRYSSPRSFLDLVHLPSTRDKLVSVKLKGPAPNTFPPSGLSAPHWGRRDKPNVPYTNNSYQEVRIADLHLPSFSHVTKLLQHFRSAEEYRFESLQWDGKVADPTAHFVRLAGRFRPAVTISAGKCTDNLALCLQTAMMYPGFPLHAVPERDYSWAMHMMSYIHDSYNNLSPEKASASGIYYNLQTYTSEQTIKPTISFRVQGLHMDYPGAGLFFCCDIIPYSPRSGRRSPPPVRIAGVAVVVYAPLRESSNTPLIVDLNILREEIKEHCKPRVVVFAFGSYALLQAAVEQLPVLAEPLSERQTYLFVCRRSKQHAFRDVGHDVSRFNRDWVAINPATLQATGEYWESDSEIVSELLESR